jgi:predicted membrane-bound spermidine synthase
MSTSTYTRIPPLLLIGTGAVIFLANFGLLALQLVGPKMLAPFIGSSVETWTCVIGAFLTGIALGNWVGGHVADRFPSSKTVAVLLTLSGLSAFGMIGLYDYALSSGFYKSIPLGPRIPALAFLFCLLPALLMSLLTPVTIKLLLPDVGSTGRIAGLIFALSTLGCLIGDYLTGFYILAEFRLNTIAMGVGIGLIALAIPVLLIRQVGGAAAHQTAIPAKKLDATDPRDGAWDFRSNIRLAYLVVFLASFCGMSLELTGSRILAPILGVSLFTWTGIIGVMLAGTACGNYLGGVLADRGVGPAACRFALLCGFLVGAFTGPIAARSLFGNFNPDEKDWIEYAARALAAIVGVVLVVPGIYMSKTRRGRFLALGIVGGLLGMLVAHMAMRSISKVIDLSGLNDVLDTMTDKSGVDVRPWFFHGIGFVIGLTITLLFVWESHEQREKIPRTSALSGTLFAGGLMALAVLLMIGIFNQYDFMTREGDIVDKVVAWTFGLFFLPMLALGTISPQVIRLSVPDVKSAGRVAGSVYAWSTIGAIVGTFVTGYFLISALGTYRVLMVLSFVLAVLSFFVGRLWKNNAMLYGASIVCGGAVVGLFIVRFGVDRFDMETKYYAIKVTRQPDLGEHAYSLTLDHLWHSIVRLDDPTWLYYKHEYVQAELLLQTRAHNPKTNLLVIGGGGYTFPRYAELTTPDVDIEVVEIDPGVTKIAHDKLGFSRDTKIRTFNMDGRQFVSERAAKGHYQLVMQDAVNDLSVPGHLMTKEYNDAVKATLTPDGAYLLTLIDDLPRGKLWRAAYLTMQQSFKYVTLLGSHALVDKEGNIHRGRSVYVIRGSDQPLDLVDLQGVIIRDFLSKPTTVPSKVYAPLADLSYAVSWWLDRYSHPLDEATVDRLLNEPGFKKIILTDQYCPVDNLMAEVFREQAKGKR